MQRRIPLLALAGLVVALTPLLLAAMATPSTASAGVPPDVSAFFGYHRAAQYESVKNDVRVPVRDGTELGCTIYRPGRGGQPVAGRFPGIVTGFTPYLVWHLAEVEEYGTLYATHGYNAALCSPRGTGTSGGVWTGWLTAVENTDNYDLIEWFAAQPFSDGNIGQEGQSYGGITSFRVATLRPPHLKAIAPQESYNSAYLDFSYPGGIRSTGDPEWALGLGPALGGGRPVGVQQEADWLQHPLLDDYWRQIDLTDKLDRITVPVLGFAGWSDLFQDGMARNYGALRDHMHLVYGPWGHESVFGSTAVTTGTLLAFFDRYLRGDTSVPAAPDRIATYEMPGGPWHVFRDWPPVTTAAVPLTLTTDGRAVPSSAPSGTRSYIATSVGGVDDPSGGDRVSFQTDPLGEAAVLAGAGKLHLRVTLTDPTGSLPTTALPVETNFVVQLFDVGPSGTEKLMTKGYLKASHLRSHSEPALLPLGQSFDADVPLWNVHWGLQPGHSVRAQLTAGGGNCCFGTSPAAVQPIPPLTVTVHTGAGGSSLDLPVLGMAPRCSSLDADTDTCRATAPWSGGSEPVVPEVPVAVLLPLVAVAVFGVARHFAG